MLLATGAQRGLPLDIPGANLPGVVPALDYLRQRNLGVAGPSVAGRPITAQGKDVVVLGGGDTSADCLGCALRESPLSVTEVAHGPEPPRTRSPRATWPGWPLLLRTYPAHEEGGMRRWEIEATAVAGGSGGVTAVHGHRVSFPGFTGVGPRPDAVRIPDEVVLPADLVLVAIGFAGVEDDPLYAGCGIEITEAGTVTETGAVFAAGDCVRGADLIVTAIADGRAAADRIDSYVRGRESYDSVPSCSRRSVLRSPG